LRLGALPDLALSQQALAHKVMVKPAGKNPMYKTLKSLERWIADTDFKPVLLSPWQI